MTTAKERKAAWKKAQRGAQRKINAIKRKERIRQEMKKLNAALRGIFGK